MKKNLRVALIIAALNIVLGSLSGAFAQQEPIAGGYSETSNTDPEVLAAARFAVSAEGRKAGARISLISIEQAEVQVVAGLNYRMNLRVKVNGQTQDVTVVVYRNLKRQYALSRWEVTGNRASSAAAPANLTIEQLQEELAAAYTSKKLNELDAKYPVVGRLKVVIEHSIWEGEGRNGVVTRRFKTYAQVEKWLKSREHDELPARQTMPLVNCEKGACTYNFDGGILHNHLYLQEIRYGFRKGRPYIKAIYLLDGD